MLRIVNTLTGEKNPWLPRASGEITLYVCGVTVYDHCHLGHARSAIVFDVIRNYIEYKGYSVRFVKNFTDVDDKIIQRAQRERRPVAEITGQYIRSYEIDMARLGVRPPTVAPRATDHIPEMIRLIQALISKGAAYTMEGDVYFEVERFPPYGRLSGQKRGEIIAGARVEVDARKRSPSDFALWKTASEGEPAWESPWGMGRPGWHIECSAMALHHLGETIDLHGGGADLIFPHHENEIAQSEAYTGKEFVSCWLHHGMVTVDQEKMSKSLGNFFTVKEIFEKSPHFPEAVIAEVIRFYLLSTHYRSPIDFSDGSLKAAKIGLDHFYALFQKFSESGFRWEDASSDEEAPCQSEFESVMDDDFNTARAIGLLQTLRTEANAKLSKGDLSGAFCLGRFLKEAGAVIGLFRTPSEKWSFKEWHLASDAGEVLDEAEVSTLIREREEARHEKDWEKSDAIRARLARAGIVIEDRPDGTTRIKR